MRRLVPTLIAGALALGTVSVAGADSSNASTTTTTTVAVHKAKHKHKKVALAPLTGRPDKTRASYRRSALTIKIDNTPQAHPQYGIQDADIVWEEIVEGQITRLAATFNSKLPSVVGPIRSVRRTDREIVNSLGGLFVCSGGAAYALQSIATARNVHFVDEATAGSAMFRSSARPVPHNLFANAVKLMALGGKPRPPAPQFHYEPTRSPARGRPIKSFTVGFQAGYATTYDWNARTRSWDRSIFGAPDVTATGQRVSPTNVVVLNVTYKHGAGVEGAEAILTGHGPVSVFSDGHLVRGTWRRATRHKPMVLLNAHHKIIDLRPGQTWVELLDPTQSVSLVPGR